MDFTKDKDTVQLALQMAREEGVRQARIGMDVDIENSVTVINGRIDKIFSSRGRTMYIQLYTDGRYGNFSTNMLQSDSLRSFIRTAAEATRLIEPDPCRRLPDAALCFKGPAPDLRQYDPSIENLTQKERIGFAMESSREILGRDPRLLSAETEWGDEITWSYTADSQGFEGDSLISNHTLNAMVSLRGRGNEKPESWWYESGIRRDQAPVPGCSTKALQRGIEALHPHKLPSGRYNIVVESTVASKLVTPIIKALSGSFLQQRCSFLNGSEGKRVFGTTVSFRDCPHIPGLCGSRMFDADGLATAERDIIREGRIESRFISSYYALKMGIAPTVDWPSVIRFASPHTGDLIGLAGTGVLVTDFNGGDCNIATGDFSFGIRGFYFENGSKVHPIREMNLTGNVVNLWNGFIAAGDDPRICSRLAIPSLAFEGASISGKSGTV